MDIFEQGVINLLNSKQGFFYASLILMMKREAVKMDRGAMGVCFTGGQIKIVYDPDQINKMTVPQVMFCVEHECLHLVLEHLERAGDRDNKLWNIASDMAVNGYMMDDLGPCKEPYAVFKPAEGVFADLPKGKLSEWYYDKLYDRAEKYTITYNGDGTVTVKNDKTGKSQTFKMNGDHGDWGSFKKGDESLNREMARAIIREAYSEARQRGCQPGGAISEIIEELLGMTTVNWKALLRRYAAASMLSNDRKTSWKKFSRRFNEDFPGYVRVRQPRITAHFDTSGSMSDEDLVECANELRALQRIYNATITVIECDASIEKVYDLRKFTKISTSFHGRGGTSHKPVWKYLEEHPCDLLISFTDMASDIGPEDKPRGYKVIFVTPPQVGRDVKVPFGMHVPIDNPKGGRR